MYLKELVSLIPNHILKLKLAYISPSYHDLKFRYKMNNLTTRLIANV